MSVVYVERSLARRVLAFFRNFAFFWPGLSPFLGRAAFLVEKRNLRGDKGNKMKRETAEAAPTITR